MLSLVTNSVPEGVTNSGASIPDKLMLNVLSRIFPRLSVALTTNVYGVLSKTGSVLPNITPEVVSEVPVGSTPLISSYVTEMAGDTGVADN
jgi:hypothetical protein